MKFKYTHTFADYWMLNKRVLLKSLTLKILLLLFTLLILRYFVLPILIPQWFGRPIYEFSPLGVGLAAGLLYLFVATYFRAKKRWKVAAELRIEKTYDISESGIYVTADGVNGYIEWRYIASAELWRGWILLMTNQKMYHFFPLSVVPEPDKLISLLVAKIKKVKGVKSA